MSHPFLHLISPLHLSSCAQSLHKNVTSSSSSKLTQSRFSTNLVIPTKELSIEGRPKVYRDSDTARGHTTVRNFCRDCGSWVPPTTDAKKETVELWPVNADFKIVLTCLLLKRILIQRMWREGCSVRLELSCHLLTWSCFGGAKRLGKSLLGGRALIIEYWWQWSISSDDVSIRIAFRSSFISHTIVFNCEVVLLWGMRIFADLRREI